MRDHVDQQGCINSVSDTLNFIDRLRRFDEDDICASLTTGFAACNGFLQSHDRTGVRTGNDDKIRIAARRTGSFDLFHELTPINHLFAFIVAATLRRHLILDMNPRGAHRFHLAHSAHEVDGIAIARISIGQHW